MSWQIILYESKGGHKPVEDFIKTLQLNTSTKLARQLDLLEEYGPKLAMPHAKPLGQRLFELRVRGRQEVRIIYVFVTKRNVYLLHGFIKKTRTIPKGELETALIRKIEVENL